MSKDAFTRGAVVAGCSGGSRLHRVYLSHAFGADPVRNAAAVATLARQVALDGALPIAPQIYLPAFLSEENERDLAMRLCVELVSLADELRVYGTVSAGMRLEIARARVLGIPVVEGQSLPRGTALAAYRIGD